MYLCVECGKLFEEPIRHVETHGLECPPYESWDGCPHCGGGYVKTMRCDECGEWIIGEYVELTNGAKYCDACFTLMDIIDSLM